MCRDADGGLIGQRNEEGLTTMGKKPEEKENTLPATQTTGTALAQADFGDDAGKGLENVSSSELTIPFLRILQSNNPQVKDVREGGIPGARPGMILNLATGELYDGIKGIPFVPVHRDHNYPEWTPRALGGGFVAIHDPEEPAILALRAKQGQFGKLTTATKFDGEGKPLDGTEFTETYYLYGLATDEYFGALVAFTSTQIKKYKTFMQRVTGFKYANPNGGAPVVPPMWAHKWLLQTVPEKNKKGDFYGWRLSLFIKNEDGSEAQYIKSLIPRSDPLYAQGKNLFGVIAEGKAKVDYAAATEREPGEDDAGEVQM